MCSTKNVIPNRSHRRYGVRAYSLLYWGSAVAILAPVFIVSYEETRRYSDALLTGLFLLAAIAAGMAAFIIGMVKLYRAWRVIQPLRGLDPVEHNMPRAGTAAGLMLIPLFNLFWCLRAIGGLPRRMNKFLRLRGSPFKGMNVGVAGAVCLLFWAYAVAIVVNYCSDKVPESLFRALACALLVLNYKFVLQMNLATEMVVNCPEPNCDAPTPMP